MELAAPAVWPAVVGSALSRLRGHARPTGSPLEMEKMSKEAWKNLMLAKCCYEERTRSKTGQNERDVPVLRLKRRRKNICDMSAAEKLAKREQWRINSKNYRLRKSKNRREAEGIPFEIINFANDDQAQNIPSNTDMANAAISALQPIIIQGIFAQDPLHYYAVYRTESSLDMDREAEPSG